MNRQGLQDGQVVAEVDGVGHGTILTGCLPVHIDKRTCGFISAGSTI